MSGGEVDLGVEYCFVVSFIFFSPALPRTNKLMDVRCSILFFFSAVCCVCLWRQKKATSGEKLDG